MFRIATKGGHTNIKKITETSKLKNPKVLKVLGIPKTKDFSKVLIQEIDRQKRGQNPYYFNGQKQTYKKES